MERRIVKRTMPPFNPSLIQSFNPSIIKLMKKNYWLLAIFLLLAGATAWYVFSGKKDENRTLGWDRLFKVPEAEIHKILSAKRTGVTTTIVRDGDGWKVNGKWKAGKNGVENRLEAVSTLELADVAAPVGWINLN